MRWQKWTKIWQRRLNGKMGDIPKPDLVELMNLFIGWGMTVLKKKWLDRVGYK